jgi:hypothetical protein
MNLPMNAMVSSKKMALLLNIIGFQLCWIACVIGGNLWASLCVSLFMFWHWCQLKTGELWLIITITLVGTLFDSLLLNLDLLTFPSYEGPLIPLWLILLWTAFSATLYHSMAWLLKKPLLAATLGAVAAPWSYYAGSLFDAVQLTSPALLLIASAWALLLGAVALFRRER